MTELLAEDATPARPMPFITRVRLKNYKSPAQLYTLGELMRGNQLAPRSAPTGQVAREEVLAALGRRQPALLSSRTTAARLADERVQLVQKLFEPVAGDDRLAVALGHQGLPVAQPGPDGDAGMVVAEPVQPRDLVRLVGHQGQRRA